MAAPDVTDVRGNVHRHVQEHVREAVPPLAEHKVSIRQAATIVVKTIAIRAAQALVAIQQNKSRCPYPGLYTDMGI